METMAPLFRPSKTGRLNDLNGSKNVYIHCIAEAPK